MEATTWLKPSVMRVTTYGDSASVQAVTRVNAEQASKRSMHRPTRQPLRGRLIRLGADERSRMPSRCAGVVATACIQGKRTQHGKSQSVVGRGDQREAGDGQRRRVGMAERLVVPMKPGNAGGGKEPQFKTDATSGEVQEIGATLLTPSVHRSCGRRHMLKRRSNPERSAGKPASTQVVVLAVIGTRIPRRMVRATRLGAMGGQGAADQPCAKAWSCPRAGCGRSASPVR